MMRQKNEKAQRRGKMPPPVGRHLTHSAWSVNLSTSFHAGVDTSVIALWLGHEQADTTQIYLLEVSGIASAGRETAGQQVARLAERRSGRPDASPVTWEDPAAIPSDE
jgi:hypothetical protein